MTISNRPPNHVAIIGLLALLPVIWYATGRSLTAGLFAAVNVCLIVVALYVAMGPVETNHGQSNDAST